MAELADALDLGSSSSECRFDSCYPHRNKVSYMAYLSRMWGFFHCLLFKKGTGKVLVFYICFPIFGEGICKISQ